MTLPEPATPDELSDFYWRRAASTGTAWLALMLAACVDALLKLA